MLKKPTATTELEQIAAAAAECNTAEYILRLYVTGTTAQSTRAISNIRKICEENLEGRYELEIVDISLHPILAKGEQIIAAPTLIKRLPLPLRRFIGDMSQTERILLGLDLCEAAAKASSARKS
jgi:circadian clock protein KaiB